MVSDWWGFPILYMNEFPMISRQEYRTKPHQNTKLGRRPTTSESEFYVKQVNTKSYSAVVPSTVQNLRHLQNSLAYLLF